MDVELTFSLPSPTDTPYRTPSSSRSRQSREYEDMSPTVTPPPILSDEKAARRRSNDSTNAALDERLSPLDPRRFTPTLHASLVSEILSLRRDIESKTRHIDQLEQSLQSSLLQTDSLNKSINASSKEVRLVKRQMQHLEGGTLSAINDLSKERDEALNEARDLRKRFEQSQKKAKSQEESVDRTQSLWDKEKELWDAEKRVLETKIHIVEGRLRVVLNEVAQTQFHPSEDHGLLRSLSRRSRSASPVKSNSPEHHDRRQSVTSVGSDPNGGRASVLSINNGVATNLADELGLEDMDEVGGHKSGHDEGRISPDALPEERGRPASSLSIKARKILGLPFDIENMEHGDRLHTISDTIIWEESTTLSVSQPSNYVDSAVQSSLPGSPTLRALGGQNPGASTEQADSECHSTVAGLDNRDENWHRAVTLPSAAMVSCSCQTAELMLSPPLTPQQNDKFLDTIQESVYERPETKEMATQTDILPHSAGLYCHLQSKTGDRDLNVPTIAIIPPASRPATPENDVVLPPQTKSVGCQVDVDALYSYVSTSMQTEEIRVDRRNIFSPHLMPGALVSGQIQAATSTGKSPAYPRRARSNSQPQSNSGMKRSAPAVPPLPPLNDDGPLAMDYAVERTRPIRSSSLFAGFDDQIDELDDDFNDDAFEDDEVFNRPIAKYTLQSGKLISHQKSLEDISELTASSAGEAVALEMLRQGEDSLPPELRRVDATQREKSLSRTSTIRRGGSSSRPSSMRRAAMITSGAAAHQSKHSQSTIDSLEPAGVPPPMPIPLRYSSARVSKSFSEGGRNSRGNNNTSPTRQARHRGKPLLRKSKSGPALSPGAPATRRQRSKSPPYVTRISIVPEMPNFEMPGPPRPVAPSDLVNTPQEASAPRPSVATGPSRSYHAKSDSNAGALQQTSVVDAIAQTMVGEWMYKYVRRRKSFGKPDKDWDPNKSADELINNPSSAGVRHKRWVWVAPYERAVMWSSKQPTSGTALLGKSGRRLTIKSVLDVNDENPMPKNSLTGPQFNRSILILTPQRALKFTATSQERHFIWLTALSFMSHSPLSIGDLAALPPPPGPDVFDMASPPLSFLGPSSRRRIRDSIRVAKGPSRQTTAGRSFTTDGSVLESDRDYQDDTRPATRDTYSTANDAALPPVIKRYHNRQRSNTAPKAPSSAFRSIPYRDAGPLASSSYNTQSIGATDRGSSDRGQLSPSLGDPSIPSSRRGSEASALGRPHYGMSFVSPSLFDSNSSHNATMTMRMDAFIDNKQAGKGGFRNLRLGPNNNTLGHTRSNDHRGDMAFWGLDGSLPSISPVNSLSPVENSFRYSGSTGRGSVERDHFRGF